MRSHVLVLVSTLLVASAARADVAPPPRRMLTVGDVRVVPGDTDAPREERARATSRARASMERFLSRISRCMEDHGGFAAGNVRARIQYDRATLPTRAHVVEGHGPLRACVAEVLPSIELSEAPHGRITIDVRVVAIDGWSRPG